MTLTENLLRATLQYLQREDADRASSSKKRFVGIHADKWLGPAEIQLGDETFAVQECHSPLAVRAAMDAWQEQDMRLVLVTQCDSQQLGCDVEARVMRNRFQRADPWQAVQARFGAERVAPSVPREDWLRDLLLAIPDYDLPRLQTSVVLDVDTVWAAAFAALRIPTDGNLQALLSWACSPEAAQLAQQPSALKDGVRARIATLAGASGIGLIEGVLSGHGDKMPAMGLVLRTLITAKQDLGSDAVAVSKAEARLEKFLGGRHLELGQIDAWADAAESHLRTLLTRNTATARQIVEQAESLLENAGITNLAGGSHYLRSGLTIRERALAEALTAAIDDQRLDVTSFEQAMTSVLQHAWLPMERSGEQSLHMAARLLRWLRTETATSNDFQTLAEDYTRSSSFVDLARELLDFGGPLQPALRSLWDAIQTRREQFNERFAQALAKQVAAPSEFELFVPLEDVLRRVVAPIAERSRVLLVVLDGASLAIFHHIIGGLNGWEEVGPDLHGDRLGHRLSGIAVLPTMTSISRTSLFCGKVCEGNQNTEKAAFAAHEFLRGHKAPVLFHKDDLSGDRLGLSEAVQKTITGDKSPQVVGVVVNAIDDWLSKGDQDAAPWTLERIKPLMELLQCAAASDRTLVITSDHGHVREHGTTFVHESPSARHRTGNDPDPTEITLTGPRVVSSDSPLIVPWTEKTRYTRSKQHGYHGGATPQEVLVPLSIFVPAGVELADYEPIAVQQPIWWESATAPAATPAVPKKPASKSPVGKKKVPEPSSMLPFSNTRKDLVADLLQCELYQMQAVAAGKMRVADDRVAAILGTLAEAGDSLTMKALSVKLGLPSVRLNGNLMGLRRVLNLDGIEVLEIDSSSNTVRISWSLLKTQFEIGDA